MVTGANADICLAGFYCPEQTHDPVPCPEATYSPTPGLHNMGQCLNSTGGYFCNETGRNIVLKLNVP